MKILHVLNELKFSGAEIMYTSASQIFQDLGCDLTVLETSYTYGEYAPHFKEVGYKVIHKPYPKKIRQRIQYYREIIELFNDEKYDVIHIHRSNMKFGMSFCAYKAGIKSIYTIHNVFKSHWYSYFLHLLQRLIMQYIFKCTFQAISDTVYMHERKYYHNKYVVPIFNWYNTNCFYPSSTDEKQIIRNKLGLPQNNLLIISIGGCSPIKRHHEIIKALPLIIKNIPNTTYIHLGSGISLDEEKELAKKLHVDKYIKFYGNQSNVREYLIASDIYIMCSTHEGISITTIEAMACKIPAILYNVPGLRDFNKEKECAILIPESPTIMAETIISLYKNNIKQHILTENAYNFINSNFDMKTNVNKIFKLYKE